MNFSLKNTKRRAKELTSKRPKIFLRLMVVFYRFIGVAAILFVFACISGGFGLVKGLIDTAPSVKDLNVVPTGYVTTVYDNQGKEIQTLVGKDANREYVTLNQIPADLKNAFVAIEDARFWTHQGIDAQGILRAFFNGLSGGSFNQGASTLTQQLLKNQVFNGGQETTFVAKMKRKIQEQYLAVQLENELSKEQILEYYLNLSLIHI